MKEKLRALVAEIGCLSVDDVEDGSRFREDLAFDVDDMLDLATEIEGEFRVSLTDEEIDNVKTFSELVALVGKYVEAA